MSKEKISKVKIIAGVIIVILLITFVICCCIYPFLNESSKAIVYLNLKYPFKWFEIEQMSGINYFKEAPITCDGSIFVPSRDDKNRYEALYKVTSKSDNITFDVYCLRDNWKRTFYDSYDAFKELNELFEDIEKYIIEKTGYEHINTIYQSAYLDKFKLKYETSLYIYVDEKFEEDYDIIKEITTELVNDVYNKQDGTLMNEGYYYYYGDSFINLKEIYIVYMLDDKRIRIDVGRDNNIEVISNKINNILEE